MYYIGYGGADRNGGVCAGGGGRFHTGTRPQRSVDNEKHRSAHPVDGLGDHPRAVRTVGGAERPAVIAGTVGFWSKHPGGHSGGERIWAVGLYSSDTGPGNGGKRPGKIRLGI